VLKLTHQRKQQREMIMKDSMKLLQLKDALREHPEECNERAKILRAIKFEESRVK
jgi:hypothetical protein